MVYASDLLGNTSSTKSSNPIKVGSGILFTSISGAALGLAVANFRHTGYLPSLLVGGLLGGIIGKVLI
jgi:hypothetical protein